MLTQKNDVELQDDGGARRGESCVAKTNGVVEPGALGKVRDITKPVGQGRIKALGGKQIVVVGLLLTEFVRVSIEQSFVSSLGVLCVNLFQHLLR